MQEVSAGPEQQQPVEPLASVLIVCYNRAQALRRCLEALEKSEQRARLDIIVLDTGSRDGTGRLDTDFPDVTFLRMPRNFGATKALNIGIRTAKAPLLLLLDPAVELPPPAIAQLAKLLGETPEAGAICPLLTAPGGQPLPQVRALPDRALLGTLWRDPAAMPASVPGGEAPLVATEYGGRKALMVPKTFLKGMNYFDEGYGDWGPDLELAFQIRHASKRTFIATTVRAVDHSPAEGEPNWDTAQLATLAADRLNGAAHFLGKRAGMGAEWALRIGAVFGSLLRLVTFQQPGFQMRLLVALLGGQKIDGSQSGL